MNCNKRDTIYMYYKHMGTLFLNPVKIYTFLGHF